MTRTEFTPLADALRAAILDYYRDEGLSLAGDTGRTTLETNSGYVERRGRPLVELLGRHAGLSSLEGLELVDLGAGFGALSVYFAAHGASVTAVDVNDSRLRVGQAVAAAHDLPIRFLRGSMQALKLDPGTFDLAVQNNSLCYVVAERDRRAALAGSRELLRPGGWLIQRNPNRWTPLDQFTSLPLLQLLPPTAAVATAARLGRRRSLVRVTSPVAARRELTAAGFGRVIRADPAAGERPWLPALLARYQHFLAQRSPLV